MRLKDKASGGSAALVSILILAVVMLAVFQWHKMGRELDARRADEPAPASAGSGLPAADPDGGTPFEEIASLLEGLDGEARPADRPDSVDEASLPDVEPEGGSGAARPLLETKGSVEVVTAAAGPSGPEMAPAPDLPGTSGLPGQEEEGPVPMDELREREHGFSWLLQEIDQFLTNRDRPAGG